MKKRSVLIVLALLVVFSGLLAFERPLYKHKGHKGEFYQKDAYFHKGTALHRMHGQFGNRKGHLGGFRYILSKLDLTNKQIEKIDNNRNSFVASKIENQGKIKKLLFEKRIALKNNKFEKAKNLNDEIADIRKNMANDYVDYRKNVWDILTKDQKTKAKKLLKSQFFHRYEDEEEEIQTND